jgi:hypothetical protein
VIQEIGKWGNMEERWRVEKRKRNRERIGNKMRRLLDTRAGITAYSMD